MNNESSQWIIPVVLALAVAAGLWFFARHSGEPEPVAVDSVPAQEPRPDSGIGPLHPLPELSESADDAELRPLPPLDASDEYFKLELTQLYGEALGRLLVESGLIEKIVATVDNLPRAHVSEKIRPLGKLEGIFAVDGQDGSGEYTLNPDNFARFDALVTIVTSADLGRTVDMYRRFYPLFQSAYVNLGYPDGYFNDRLIEVIDHLLEAPEVEGPIELLRPNVLYQFADPELESRSSGQKLLIRMGAGNAARTKQTLRELRAAIVAG
jgi:hypothetical protein